MTNPFLDAIRAVKHSNPQCLDDRGTLFACFCDRDFRIAKGFLEALLVARRGGGHPSNADEELAAFVEAAK